MTYKSEDDIQHAWDITAHSNMCIDSTDGHLAVLKGILLGRSLERQEIIDQMTGNYENLLKNAKGFRKLGAGHQAHAAALDFEASSVATEIIELIFKKFNEDGLPELEK
ncbi:MAG: hypothetical protein P4L79_09915 [Legionella sp.]|uniref:hypothetical protein n=1 Tax=Legionella sp. TaxID=459 RepID=UPI002851596A|nr:hypothetical protein [Legionella sp.]